MPTYIVSPKINIEIQKKLVEQVFGTRPCSGCPAGGGGGGPRAPPPRSCAVCRFVGELHCEKEFVKVFSFQLLPDFKCDS